MGSPYRRNVGNDVKGKLGARVVETVSRVRLAFAAACPEANLLRAIASNLLPAGP